MRASKSLQPSEHHIQQTCTELLKWDGWRALRTDPVSDRGRGKGFGEPGMADHLYIRYGGPIHVERLRATPAATNAAALTQAMWIEWKRVRGKKATAAGQHQKDWHRMERARGALTLIAGEDFPATIEGFIEWYRGSGLQRKAFLMRGRVA